MGIIVASGATVSVTANSKSSDQVTGTYQFAPGNGYATLFCKSSAAGLNVTYLVNGQAMINDQAIPYFGTTGGMSVKDNVLASNIPVRAGSRQELVFRNTTGGTLTADFQLTLD